MSSDEERNEGAVASENMVTHFPVPLYLQRYGLVRDVLDKHKIESVVDFGSAKLRIFQYLKRLWRVRRVALVDVDRGVLAQWRRSVEPLIAESLLPRRSPLTVSVFHGCAGKADGRLADYQAATLVEVIEHLEPEVLKQVTRNVFGRLRPSVVIVTTPNAEFNVLFPGLTGFRHWDHKFEWTREQFQKWCEEVCRRYGYAVDYTGVGDAPEAVSHLGFCSQAGIFRERLGRAGQKVEDTPYELVKEVVFPYDSRTPAQVLTDEVTYQLIQKCQRKRRQEQEEEEQEEERRRRKEEEARAKKDMEERKRRKKEKDVAEKARKAEEEEEEERRKKRSREKGSQGEEIRQAQEPKMIPSPSLPVGWEKRLDNSTRRYYYIDHNHGKTQWEPPAMTEQPPRKDTYTMRLKEEPAISSRGGLSRSHSSPDIMKQLAEDEEEEGEGGRTGGSSSRPVYDRTSKPSVSTVTPEVSKPPSQRQFMRRRDLNPVYGNVGSAMTGLRNLGNTCYMNSTVQCLNNTTPLVSYLLNDHFLNDINRDSVQGMHGEVVDEFAVVVKALWSGQYRCITPRDLKNTVGKYNPMFAGYQQQDSQEFLTFLLDGLHEGLNEVKKRPQIPDQDNDRLPDSKAAALAWENHKKLHRSIIVELFQGQLKSTLMCRTCHKKSVTFQAFMYISLPIPASSKCSLRDCFRAFLQPEMMTGSCKWKCPQCRVERDAEKKIDIWKLPHILLIGLNRFVSDGMWMQKKTTYVDFPVDQLDLGEFTLGPKHRSHYNLYGVSNHYGTMEGGHYTAFCRNPCNSKWHKFDDQEVYDMSKSDVKTSAAFVLYYTSIPLNAPQFKPQL